MPRNSTGIGLCLPSSPTLSAHAFGTQHLYYMYMYTMGHSEHWKLYYSVWEEG